MCRCLDIKITFHIRLLVYLETCTHILFACFEFVYDRFLSLYTYRFLIVYRFLVVYRLPSKWDWNLSCTDCFACFPFPPFALSLHALLILLIWRACHQEFYSEVRGIVLFNEYICWSVCRKEAVYRWTCFTKSINLSVKCQGTFFLLWILKNVGTTN